MDIPKHKKLTLWMLAFVFAMPGLLAIFYFNHPEWLMNVSKKNKGTLISPPVVLKPMDKKGKWRLIYWKKDTCDKACVNQLNTMSKIRLALGRKLYQVDEWLLMDTYPVSEERFLKPIFREQDVQVRHVNDADRKKLIDIAGNEGIFIADPENYLILQYPMGVDPEDVFRDLKVLLGSQGMGG